MFRFIVHKFSNNLSFIKTYPSGMEEKLSLKTSIYTLKRFHWIHCQIGIGLTSTNTHFTGKRYISIISISSELEPVLIYTNPDEHKGLIAKQNKNKSGVYRWVHKDSVKAMLVLLLSWMRDLDNTLIIAICQAVSEVHQLFVRHF